jgi:uncharacterized damage-inducible protein DinB
MKEYLVKLAHYNLWANQKMISMISTDEKIFCAPVKNSFPSIKDTLLHIWDAQDIWFTRLNDKPITDFPSKNFKGNNEDVVAGLIKSSEDFYLFLDKQLPTYDTKIFSYKNMAGESFSSTAVDIVTHCMNHSTFHRGQLITILRGFGQTKFESTDLIAYHRAMKEVKKEILD